MPFSNKSLFNGMIKNIFLCTRRSESLPDYLLQNLPTFQILFMFSESQMPRIKWMRFRPQFKDYNSQLQKMKEQQITNLLFSNFSILKAQQLLQDDPSIDLRTYQDARGNNLLHHIAYYDHRDLLMLYLAHVHKLIARRNDQSRALYQKDPKRQITSWVNQKNNEGIAPLHYAALYGHSDMIRILLENGAAPLSITKNGMSAIHMAAQNNKVSSIARLQHRADLNARDNKGRTPLHDAAEYSSDDVAAYLVTFPQIDLDPRDDAGRTPLLLAAMNGNSKIVRMLLMKGADRRIKAKNGDYPMKVARSNQFKTIVKMLNDSYTFLDMFKFYYNVKRQYKPKSRSLVAPVVFLITTLASLVIFHGLLVYKDKILFVIEGWILGPMLLLYFSLLRAPKAEPRGNLALVLNENKNICFECLRKKPPRSYHCQICKTCVQQYDHHCLWINNCVGKYNIARFIVYVLFLVLSFGWIGFISLWSLLKLVIWPSIDIWSDQFIQFRQQTANPLQKTQKIILLSLNVLISCFLFPVLLLFILQIKNLFVNKTTYERIKGQNKTVKEALKNKKKKGPSLSNFKTMCSGGRSSFRGDLTKDNSVLDEQFMSENDF